MSEKMHNIKRKATSGLVWMFLENGGKELVQFLVQLVLARILLPDDYGVVAIISVFIQLTNALVWSGFGNALIQKKDADDLDFSSVFYASIFLSILLYAAFFFAAPFIADFYEKPVLLKTLRWQFICVIFYSATNVWQAILQRTLQFKKSFIRGIAAVLASAAAGLFMAARGYGVWALVAQALVDAVVGAAALALGVRWRPQLAFSFKRLKILFRFGWKLLAGNVIMKLADSLHSLVIAKAFSAETLAYANRGRSFPRILFDNINNSVRSVMFSVLSIIQDERERMKAVLRRSVLSASFVLFPALFGLIAIADPLIRLVLTDKWAPAIPMLQIYCLSYLFMPLSMSNTQAINALGRSDVYLALEALKRGISLVILFVSVFYGIYAVLWGRVASAFISCLLDAYPNRRLLDYGFTRQMKDIFPALLLSAVMWGALALVPALGLPMLLELSVQIAAGFLIYLSLAYVFKLEGLKYAVDALNALIKPRNS